MSDTVEVRQWGKVTQISAALFHALGADYHRERLALDWTDAVERAGYVPIDLEPQIAQEPRWWIRGNDGVPMLMPMGEGEPDVYEFRAIGPVRERAANEPCGHGSTVEVSLMSSPRRVLLCNWCDAELDGGPW